MPVHVATVSDYVRFFSELWDQLPDSFIVSDDPDVYLEGEKLLVRHDVGVIDGEIVDPPGVYACYDHGTGKLFFADESEQHVQDMTAAEARWFYDWVRYQVR